MLCVVYATIITLMEWFHCVEKIPVLSYSVVCLSDHYFKYLQK